MLDGLLASLRQITVRIGLKRRLRRVGLDEIDISASWRKVQRCLVCWPQEGVDLEAAKLVLNRLYQRFPEAAITIVALPGLGASPFEAQVEIVRLEKSDLNWFGWLTQSAKAKLEEVRADLAVDLSPHFNPLAALVCLLSNAPLRVGFACEHADLAFNFQIAPRPGQARLERYRALSQYLG